MNHIQSPATGDQAIERAIVSAGANVAPRVTPADIESAIASEHYFTTWWPRVTVGLFVMHCAAWW